MRILRYFNISFSFVSYYYNFKLFKISKSVNIRTSKILLVEIKSLKNETGTLDGVVLGFTRIP